METVVKHGSHDQKSHGRGGGATLRNQDEPMNPETAWVHSTTWYHGTSRPDLVTLDARNAPSRYPNMGSSYSLMAHNFATNDRDLAAQYARDAVDMDMKNGITGARAVVYEVKPTSDYFDPDPHSGPGGWNDGPEDMSVAFDIVDGGGGVSIRFHDEMDIVGAFDADTGEPITVQKMAEMVKHGSHNQASHNPHKGKAGDLPEGWSQRSKDDILAESRYLGQDFYPNDPARAESFATSRADSITQYNGPNGSVVRVTLTDGSQPDPATMNTALTTINRLQEQSPVKDLRVEFSDAPWRDHAADVSADAKAFVMRGEKTINIKPQYATGEKMMDVDDDFFMPAAKGTDQLDYVITHEYGHVRDRRNRGEVNDDRYNNSANSESLSRYGRTNEYEAYAESFTEYSLTGGKTTNPAVLYYADKYFWGENMTKAADDDVFDRVIIFDTFDSTVPPTVKEEITKAVYVAFEPGLRPVLKHGSHDQSTHGRRGGGGSSLTLDAGVAQSIVERVRANGGLSVSMVDGSEPTEGFMVAKGGKQSAIVDADEFYDPVKGPEAMSSFLKGNRELSEGAYLGLWHNQADGKVYLDVSENIMDRATAIAAGRERDQISIWDVANFEEIDTGGTGQVGKAVAGSETAGPVQDDRRGDRRVRKESVGEGGGAVVVFEPGLRPVLKHGSHDQSSHGRGRGGGKRYAPADSGLMRDITAQQDAMARALMNNDFSGLDIGSSRLAARVGGAEAAVMKRIQSIAARVGIKRKKRWKYTADEASSLRDSYYERYGKPSWMGKAFKIIRKHLGGAHDQKAHGRGKGGGESGWGERQKEIDAMASAGPPAGDLDAALSPIDDDDVRARIAEDYAEDIESDAREYVEERMAEDGWVDNSDDPDYEEPLIGKTYQEEFDERMAQERENYIDSYVDNYGPEYRDAMRGDLALDEESFNEVYGTSHTGITNDGREVTLTAQVESVYAESDWGDAYIQVNGTVYDADGNWAGEFERKFFKDEYGDVVVEHALLNIDPEYQGTGFSQVFNRTAENYYISHGIDKIDIHAALDVGGYAWAKQGFDWAPKGGATSNVKRRFDDVLRDSSLPASVFNSGTSLRARLDLPSYDPDYPTPREVASWGYVQGASTWPGKQTLLGSDWYGQKSLTPSGPRQSTTQQEAASTVAEVPGQMEIPGVVS